MTLESSSLQFAQPTFKIHGSQKDLTVQELLINHYHYIEYSTHLNISGMLSLFIFLDLCVATEK